MMIDIDEHFAIGYAPSHFPESVEARRIGCNNTVEFDASFGLLKKMLWIEKLVLLWQPILIPTDHFLSFAPKSMSQSELRANAIAVGTNMADNAKGSILANDMENLVNNFRMGFHYNASTKESTIWGVNGSSDLKSATGDFI